MPSKELEIWNALAAMPVTLNGRVIPVFGPGHTPGPITSAMLPLRILHPYHDRAENIDVHFRGLGTKQVKQTIVIVDFCAIAPLSAPAPTLEMIEYAVAYTEMCTTWRAAGGDTDPTIKAELKSWGIVKGYFEWPAGSQTPWHGVQATLTIDEYPQ